LRKGGGRKNQQNKKSKINIIAMRRTAVVALRSQRGHLLVGHVPSPIVLGSRSLSTSADDLLQLFKQAAANKGTARDAAPPSSSAAATPKPAAAGRAKASSNHWAKKLATQLESSVSATAPPTHEPKFAWKERAPRAVNDPKHRRQALYSPVAGTAPAQVTEETRLFVKAKKRPRGPMRDTPSSLAEDTRFHDDDFDDDDFRRPSAREEKDDTDAELSFSSTLDEGGDDDWEAMAAEMNAWGAKLHKTLQPHLEVINKHIRSKRVRRQKYMMFLERVIARRRANKYATSSAARPPNPTSLARVPSPQC
jgi:hypothetical protein